MIPPQKWLDKPYYSLDAYCKEAFGKKLYKLAIDGGFTCPNRDGTKGSRGCIFCSAGGSGEFAVSIHEDLQKGISLLKGKKTGDAYIAYFQAYTNTYAPPQKLCALYERALSQPGIAGISIATRPDCLGSDVLDVFTKVRKAFPDKFLWVELGLQTMHEDTAAYIRRGYSLPVFEQAIADLKALSIPVILHMILGLPGETPTQILQTIDYVNHFSPFGVKLQLLHILKGTDLAADYEKGLVPVYTREEYLEILLSCITHLHPDIVIHRITGDGKKDLLLAPLWSLNKRDVLNGFHKLCRERGAYQGQAFTLGPKQPLILPKSMQSPPPFSLPYPDSDSRD